MIQPITKLVTIKPLTEHQQQLMRLDTADGRFSLAERILADVDTWCQEVFDDGPRSHLGASVIGSECARHIWYTLRWFKHKRHSGRMLRLFQDGHWYEERFIEMLRGIGINVTQVDVDGKQMRIAAVDGHFGGSCDGVGTMPQRYGAIAGHTFLLEFKTSNTNQFTKFHDVKESKPQHWAQMCVYGVKMNLTHAIYCIVNKNDADLHFEVVELDLPFGQQCIDKGEWIIKSPLPPPKLSDNPSDWRCKMCDHHAVCHLNQSADVNCRSCVHASATVNAAWYCNLWKSVIPSHEALVAGCSSHQPLQG